MQHTLKSDISFEGIGLHSGAIVRMRILPARADHGIVFKRVDVMDKCNLVPALWSRVIDTQLCTVIGNDDGVRISTVEHLMAALRGCGVDNALIEIDGPELPQLDGSSQLYVDRIEEVGTTVQHLPRRAIRILKEITVQEGDKAVRLSPYSGSRFSGEIKYDHPMIGQQVYDIQLVNGNFRHDLASTRSFCLFEDVEAMQKAGLAKGGSLDNAVVFDHDGVMNPEGLRFDDECIRHKLLDAVGDLYLAGGIIIGAYEGKRIGHSINNAILRKLFADDSAWMPVDLFIDIDEADHGIYKEKPRSSAVAVA